MTGGAVVVLGPVGLNFAAGMTGGQAFVYDEDQGFEARLNPTNVVIGPLEGPDEGVLKALIQAHLDATGSPRARSVLETWSTSRHHFRVVTPKDLLVARQARLKIEA
jgi:glutamate synthase (NADPH/NADH) large chain